MCDPDKMKPEEIPGIPDDLPEGERLLWQGKPDWQALALHVFHVRAVAIYFGILVIWALATGMADGIGAAATVANMALVGAYGLAGLGLLTLLAWLIARSTIYSITSERVLIRAGVALPKTVNIPFKVIGSADLKLRKSGNGDIPLETTGPERIAYLNLWPHARPWRLSKAVPMLRGLPDAAATAQLLAGALAEKAGQPAPRIAVPEEAEDHSGVMPGQTAAANT